MDNDSFNDRLSWLKRGRFSVATKIMLLVCVPVAIQFALIGYLAVMQQRTEMEAIRAERASKISTIVNGLVHDLAVIASTTSVGEAGPSMLFDIKSLVTSVQHIAQTFRDLEELVQYDPAKLQVVKQAEMSLQQSALIFKELMHASILGDNDKLKRKERWRELR
ncbi:MAG: hypothetical protein ACRD3W_24430, partial [Terriglobales bacterium]